MCDICPWLDIDETAVISNMEKSLLRAKIPLFKILLVQGAPIWTFTNNVSFSQDSSHKEVGEKRKPVKNNL